MLERYTEKARTSKPFITFQKMCAGDRWRLALVKWLSCIRRGLPSFITTPAPQTRADGQTRIPGIERIALARVALLRGSRSGLQKPPDPLQAHPALEKTTT